MFFFLLALCLSLYYYTCQQWNYYIHCNCLQLLVKLLMLIKEDSLLDQVIPELVLTL